MKKSTVLLTLFLALVLIPENIFAQCGMCRAVLESSAESGSKIAEGVNNGILYMMGVPYLLMFVIGFAWYKKYGKANLEK